MDILNGNLNIVGINIKNARQKNKLSRQQLSTNLLLLGIDIADQSIYDIEMGTRTVVDYELCAIAKILNTSTDILLKDFREQLDKI